MIPNSQDNWDQKVRNKALKEKHFTKSCAQTALIVFPYKYLHLDPKMFTLVQKHIPIACKL